MNKFNEAIQIDDTAQYRVVEQPNKKKKITGTRFSKVIGCNQWGSQFQAWCEIMKVAEPPFEGNKYTEAGQAIESKLLDFAREQVSPYIQDPEAYYRTDDAKKKMFYNFFCDDIFGGMWDGLAFDRDGVIDFDNDEPLAVIECKTTSRPQDWTFGVPDNYKAQGMLYAALLGIEDVYFPVAFLEPDDYDHPEDFVCTDENTRIYKVSVTDGVGDFNNIFDAIKWAENWWDIHIDNNFSPVYNEDKDKEYLAIIRQCGVADLGGDLDEVDYENLDALLSELLKLDTKIEDLEKSSGLEELRGQRKKVNAGVQKLVKDAIGQTDGKDALDTDNYRFKVSPTKVVNYDKLEEDGLFDLYVTFKQRITTTRK